MTLDRETKSKSHSRAGRAVDPSRTPKPKRGDNALELAEVGDSTTAKLTVALCALLVVFFLVWASMVDVAEKVSGSGVIELQGNIERIEHPDGGIVKMLSTQVDDMLSPDDIILEFDTAHIERELFALSARIDTLRDERMRVRFLLEDNPSMAAYDRDPGDAGSEAFWSEQDLRVSQLAVLDAEENRLTTQISNLRDQTEFIVQERAIVLSQLERYASAAESGVARLTDKEQLQRQFIQLNGMLSDLDGRAADLSDAKRQIGKRKRELLAQNRRDAAVRLTKVEEELATLQAAEADAKARMDRASVRTRAGGKVQHLEILRSNEVVAPGDVIAEIVPYDSAFRAVVNVSADRIGAVRTGMDVSLKVLSYDFTRFGDIAAQVTEVSPTSFANQQGEIMYRVTVDVPSYDATTAQRIEIRPGMTVNADILIDNRSVLSYLLTPVRRIQNEALTET